MKAIKYNKISQEDSYYLQKLTSNRNSKLRLSNYHLHLAQKYLWNNYQPNKARINLIKSVKYNLNFFNVFFFVSFIPGKIIIYLYNMLKHKNGNMNDK